MLEAHQVGSQIRVTYVKSHPAWFYVAGQGPDPRDLAFLNQLQFAASVTAVLLTLALGAAIWWARNVGAQGSKPPPPAGAVVGGEGADGVRSRLPRLTARHWARCPPDDHAGGPA